MTTIHEPGTITLIPPRTLHSGTQQYTLPWSIKVENTTVDTFTQTGTLHIYGHRDPDTRPPDQILKNQWKLHGIYGTHLHCHPDGTLTLETRPQ